MLDSECRVARIDRRRYLRLVGFILWLTAHIVFWDVILRRFGPGHLAARTAEARWHAQAERFRRLATRQGGVLIKLGQFLSIRVDVLPPSVTSALAGLQDEVPPEPLDRVAATVADDFGRPALEVFAHLDPTTLGAASLAQVHRAALPDGTPVVVKVQRSGIANLVETDLAALQLGIRLLKRLSWVRRRSDLDALFEQFASTTRTELDFVAEGRSTERFAALFAGDERVRVPRVYWDYTRPRVLTLEDVSAIKIADTAAMEVAGIDSRAVAATVVDVYFEQVFVHNFVHADPHPGNLFVERCPQGEGGQPGAPRVSFVDFGMTAEVPERIRAHLREYLLGMATRDAARVVRAYVGAGVLLPGADLRRLEQAQAEVMQRFWGIRMGDLQAAAWSEAGAMMHEYADLVREMPFQLPSDLLLIFRAVGLLSGLATRLDPEFDIWAAMAPYARRLIAGTPESAAARHGREGLEARWEELRGQARALLALGASLEDPARALFVLPGAIERLVAQTTAGGLQVQADLTPELRQEVDRIETIVSRLIWTVGLSAGLIVGTVMRVTDGPELLSNVLMIASGAALAVLLLKTRG